MYILVNKRPFKVFDLKISDIHQMDIQTVQRMVRVGKGVIRLYNSDLTDKELAAFKEMYEQSGLKPEKITDEEYNTLYQGQQWRRVNNLALVEIDDYNNNQIFKIYFNPESYWFSVSDGDRLQFSKIYSSKEEAERARNKVCQRANALISKLLRVEI